jgi:hypothetical protein
VQQQQPKQQESTLRIPSASEVKFGHRKKGKKEIVYRVNDKTYSPISLICCSSTHPEFLAIE